MSDWHVFADRAALEAALAAEVATRLAQGIAQRGKAHLVVSGGSTPLQLFSLLSQTEIDWAKIVVLLADERRVAVEHQDSNERMVRNVLLSGHAADAEFFLWLPGLMTPALTCHPSRRLSWTCRVLMS